MDEVEARLEALRLAHHPDKQADQILLDAKKFYDFVMNEEEQE